MAADTAEHRQAEGDPDGSWQGFPPFWVVAAGLLLLDALFLHHLWRSFPDWGIWDWDLQASILEVARHSLVVDGEWPLWDRFRAGGWTLVGNPLARTLNPSFLPILLFGTIPGIKIAIGLYLWLAQLGALLWLRHLGASPWPAVLGALVFAWSGCFAQHLTHGHFEWIAYAWLPWVLWALHRAWARPAARSIAAAAVALAFLWLDGGPYQLLFVILYVGLYTVARSAQERRWAPLAISAAVGVVAAALSAVQLLPVMETALRISRPTAEASGYFGMPTPPTAADVLHQGLIARDQKHDRTAWPPFRINVGMYVGIVPLLLAGLALLQLRKSGWLLAVLLASTWLALSEELPVAPWALLHQLPGFASLQVPIRFNLFLVISIVGLAALGFTYLSNRVQRPWLGPALVALVAADLFQVNAPVYEAAFAVPPMAVEEREDFVHHHHSPYAKQYASTVRYPVQPNWPNTTFPAILENAGVILAYMDLVHPRFARAFDSPEYPGAEVVAVGGSIELVEWRITSNRVFATKRGGAGRIVVNQNYHPDWRVVSGDGARITTDEGRLALEVGAGELAVELAFRPPAFFQGAAISGVAWLAVLGVCLYSRYPRARKAS